MSTPIEDLRRAITAYEYARSRLGATRSALAKMRAGVKEMEEELVEVGLEAQEAARTLSWALKAAETALDELHEVEA